MIVAPEGQCIEIADDDGVFPIYARDAETFERLADACEEAAIRMRRKLVQVRSLAAHMEHAG